MKITTAEIIGASPQFVRVAMQRGVLNIGVIKHTNNLPLKTQPKMNNNLKPVLKRHHQDIPIKQHLNYLKQCKGIQKNTSIQL